MTEKTDDELSYKVGRAIEQHSLRGMGAKLEARWLGEGTEAQGLRGLADYFNKALLRSALEESGQRRPDGEVGYTYRLLTSDDGSSGERTQIRKTLERDGVDVEQLESEFVTHQAMYRYLTKGRGVEKETDTTVSTDTARGTVKRLQSRLVAVTETTLSRLRSADVINLGSFDILVDVTVHCADCGVHRGVLDLLADGGCDCK